MILRVLKCISCQWPGPANAGLTHGYLYPYSFHRLSTRSWISAGQPFR